MNVKILNMNAKSRGILSDEEIKENIGKKFSEINIKIMFGEDGTAYAFEPGDINKVLANRMAEALNNVINNDVLSLTYCRNFPTDFS